MCVAEQGEATGFQLELLGNSRIGVKTADGVYLKGENNGVLTASGQEVRVSDANIFTNRIFYQEPTLAPMRGGASIFLYYSILHTQK